MICSCIGYSMRYVKKSIGRVEDPEKRCCAMGSGEGALVLPLATVPQLLKQGILQNIHPE